MGDIKEIKPFLSYEQQLDKLMNDKKLVISDKDKAIRMLKKHSYFALISGYKCPFKKEDGTYKEHTSFDDIVALYKFDNNMRNILLSNILIVEKHMKSLISYCFCENFGEKQEEYLKAENYDYVAKNQIEIDKLVMKLEEIINNPKDYKYIRHQKEKHGNVPLWVLVKALTIGSVSKLYSFLQPSIKMVQ